MEGISVVWHYLELLASIIFHLFVNFMQEKIAMTPETKCVETLVITVAAIGIVYTNQELFFGEKHIGKLLEQPEE